VMTGWRALMEYQGVFVEQCFDSQIEDFMWILRLGGSCFRVFGSSKVPEFI
jgi:hypothetical protein